MNIEHSKCTLCASSESSGFYTGCMIKDGHCKDSNWTCDGDGNLFRPEPFWVNRRREKILMKDMETLYLYNTVKMIYNNVINPNDPFGDVIQWSFIQEVHTEEFLLNFFKVGLEELKLRKDNQCATDFFFHFVNLPPKFNR